MEVAITPSTLKERLTGALGRVHGGWALVDQILISGANFALIVLAARGMSPSAFGAFTLVYSIMLFANTLQTSLITQPHNVLAAGKPRLQYVAYTSGIALAQLGIAGVLSLACMVAAAVSGYFRWSAAPLLWALVAALPAWQLQEFVRRVLYTEARLCAAFFCDAISYGGQVVAILLLMHAGTLSGSGALLAIAGAFGTAAIPGLWHIRRSLWPPPDWKALRENWQFGKWLAGAEMLNWCSSVYLYQYITAIILGAAASGTLKVAQTVFGPSRVLIYFLSTVLPIWFARDLAEEGSPAMCSRLRRVSAIVLPLIGAYCLLVCVLAGPILRLLYGHAYTDGAPILRLYAIACFVSCQQLLFASAMTAMRKTSLVFLGNVYGGFISVLASWFLVYALGLFGAVIGMVLTSITVTLFFWKAYRRATAACAGIRGKAPAEALAV